MTPAPPPIPSPRPATGGEPVSARARKFPCGTCGADVVWNPGAAALKCPYCGSETALPTSSDQVVERPLEEALQAPRDLGWGAERKSVRCTKCGATTTFDPGVSASRCAFCATPAVVEAPTASNHVRPAGLLAFVVDRNAASQRFRTWVSGLWFRPNDLKTKSSVTAMQGVYVPFWTFDALTHNRWTAEAGYHYTVQVEAIENGKRVLRSETRTRWQPAAGFLEKPFDDVPVPASKGLPPGLARGIEPFPTGGLVPYDPQYLSGFLAEEYAVDLPDALGTAKERMTQEIHSACAAEVPGDTQRNLQVATAWSGLTCKNALLPVWISAYEYAGKPFRFLVNGVTGKVDGNAPFSAVKIALAVAAVIALLVLFSKLN
ncbi:MAG: zinc ribbon domain-containing protein [Holophagales bacterium]|nr:zinc ribbon domain-containing protein [Holophagales bacterium]